MQHFVTLLNQSLAQLGRYKPAFHTITTATACIAALAALLTLTGKNLCDSNGSAALINEWQLPGSETPTAALRR